VTNVGIISSSLDWAKTNSCGLRHLGPGACVQTGKQEKFEIAGFEEFEELETLFSA